MPWRQKRSCMRVGSRALSGLRPASSNTQPDCVSSRYAHTGSLRMNLRPRLRVEMLFGSISNPPKIENSQISPSFDIMKRICDGLGVAIEDFVRPGSKEVVSGRKTITRRDEGDQFASAQYDYRAHSSELSRKAMVPLEILVR